MSAARNAWPGLLLLPCLGWLAACVPMPLARAWTASNRSLPEACIERALRQMPGVTIVRILPAGPARTPDGQTYDVPYTTYVVEARNQVGVLVTQRRDRDAVMLEARWSRPHEGPPPRGEAVIAGERTLVEIVRAVWGACGESDEPSRITCERDDVWWPQWRGGGCPPG